MQCTELLDSVTIEKVQSRENHQELNVFIQAPVKAWFVRDAQSPGHIFQYP